MYTETDMVVDSFTQKWVRKKILQQQKLTKSEGMGIYINIFHFVKSSDLQ